jgi:hypothetical protein
MRERGRYQLQLMKTRNSSGVGQKIDLGFDIDTLRIVDIGDEDDDGYSSAPQGGGSNILASLKRGTGTTTPEDSISDDPAEGSGVGKIRAQTDSTKLRDFLNNLDDE